MNSTEATFIKVKYHIHLTGFPAVVCLVELGCAFGNGPAIAACVEVRSE